MTDNQSISALLSDNISRSLLL